MILLILFYVGVFIYLWRMDTGPTDNIFKDIYAREIAARLEADR